ncbi:MAG: helix-turn-helix domain-containing protein [Desulfobulbales bacterium]
MQDQNMALAEVSFLLGFSDQSTFSRAFKSWTGKSPVQYRKVV